MANISFEESRAKNWQAEVEAELKLVATINEDAGRCMQDLAEEGDPLTVILKRTGGMIESFGNTMKESFFNAMAEVGSAITKYVETHQNLINDGNAVRTGH